MKKISVCSIVKEEKHVALDFISYLSTTFEGPEFEILVVDNGLDEETRQCASNFPVTMISGDPQVFDSSRELYMEKATGDYLLILDADERILSKDVIEIRKAVEDGVIAGTFPVYNYTGKGKWATFNALRMIKNHMGIHYDGREMHATLVDADGNSLFPKAVLIPAIIHHYDCLLPGKSANKRERNRKKLLCSIEKNPTDAISYMYLGLEYVAMHEYDKAEHAYQTCLALRPESNYCKYFYMLFHRMTGQNEKALAYAEELLAKGKYTEMCINTLMAVAPEKIDIPEVVKRAQEGTTNTGLCINVAALVLESDPELAIQLLNKAMMQNPVLFDTKIYANADGPNLYECQSEIITDKKVFWLLGEAYRMMGNIDKYEHYLKFEQLLERR